MKKKHIFYIANFLLIISITIFISTIFIFTNWFKDNKKNKKETEKIKEISKKTNTNTIEEENIINFDELSKINDEVVGWIKVNDTKIDYPIVQTSDNDYYLNHSFSKEYTDAGAIFMDYRNNNNFNNKNTIIYGHSRLDLSMFGTLKYTLKTDWQNKKENRYIEITTKDMEYIYEVFSTYTIQTEDYYITTEFDSDDEYNNFLNILKERSNYNYDVEVNDRNSILTLSTCHGQDEKTVLHAKLISTNLKK